MRKLTFALLCSLLTAQVFGYDFKDDDSGLCFNITSNKEPYTVEVTCENGGNIYINNYSGLTTVTIPETVTYDEKTYSVTSIGDMAFCRCTGIISITIPNTVITIGSSAFEYCDSLNFNKYDNALYLGNSDNPYLVLIKAKDKNITTCSINENTMHIYSYAFSSCNSLTSVSIPNTVITIGEKAFNGCDKLNFNKYDNALYLGNSDNPYLILIKAKDKKINTCSINESTRLISSSAFSNCDSLTSVIIPETVTSIGNSAFWYCYNLKSVIIPNSVTDINEDAFQGCFSLTTVAIPNSVLKIGSSAFYKCIDLTLVTIPNTVTSIGQHVFSHCDNLTICCESIEKPYCWHSSWNSSKCRVIWGYKIVENEYVYADCEKTKLLGYIGCDTTITIPETVTKICDRAFYGDINLSSVTIPNNVTYIGNDAFEGCDSLRVYYQGTIEDWIKMSFENANANPFYNANVYIGNKDVTSVVISEDVTKINDNVFCGCRTLASIVIPKSVTSIGKSAFKDCDSLKRVDYQGSIEDWLKISFGSGDANPLIYAHHLYINNEEVTSINVTTPISEIKDFAFWGCSGLSSVIIPNSVTSIGSYAFYGCDNLTIYCEASSKPNGWKNSWNPDNRPIIWGYVDVDEETVSNVSIYATSNTIIVENATADIYVYDTMGRLVARRDIARNVSIAMPREGIYIVKCGAEVKRIYLGFRN